MRRAELRAPSTHSACGVVNLMLLACGQVLQLHIHMLYQLWDWDDTRKLTSLPTGRPGPERAECHTRLIFVSQSFKPASMF